MIENNTLIICPSEEKIKILKTISHDKNLLNIKFMTKEEYINNYYFSFDEKALHYLMKKYNYNLDVAKVYLNNLYAIDINSNYKNNKLEFLKKLKIELIDNNFLKFNHSFKLFIENKKIKVINYFNLEKYEEEALNYKFSLDSYYIDKPVVECSSMEEEINYVCLKIIELIKQGININKIFLSNVSNEYLYTIEKLFNYYHIPINLDFKESIYTTKVVKDFLQTRKIDLNNKDKITINKKLINSLNSISDLEEDEYTEVIFIDKLKNSYLNPKKYNNAVNIKNLYKETFDNDEYVFVIGFNQDSLPILKKDIEFIDDSIKDEISLYTTSYLNKREKEVVIYLLSRIKNLYLSYKLSSPFANYYKSSIIDDLKLEIIKPEIDNYCYSNIYNKIRLAEKLDNYYLFGEKDNSLYLLNTHYKIKYKTYNNEFTGIDNDLYLKNLPYPLRISYTSINTYNECKFKYYLKNVLKLDIYQDTFASFIGSMYHKILSLYQNKYFDFETEFQKYLTNRELTLKEKILLVKIKKDLLELISELKKQQLLTGYDEALYEAKAVVNIKNKVAVEFVGYIDKIMFYKNIDDTYFSIIDYKTGYIDTHIEPIKYGLHLQLPIYLYLIHYSKLFDNPIFTGIYYQNILFNYPNWSEKLEKEKKEKYYLNGYSTSDTNILSRFDSTYEASEYIKGMKYNEEKGFGTYSKTISNETLYDLVKYTKNHIEEKCSEIVKADFSINPKIYALKNVSCEFCSFNDICFMRESNLTYLEKVNDLSFLGDDDNGLDRRTTISN